MRRRPLFVLALGAVVLGGAGVAAWTAGATVPAPNVNLAAEPKTVYETDSFPVGDTYSIGMAAVPPDVPRPVRITAVELSHVSGLEVVGTGAYVRGTRAFDLVPSWPPAAYQVQALDVAGPLDGDVSAAMGLRVIAPASGFRGVRVTWVDAAGHAGSLLYDVAAYTCSIESACPASVHDPLVMLGLRR